jgi:predicted nucleotidyltransferase
MAHFDEYMQAHRARREAAAVEAVARALEARAAAVTAAQRLGERLGVRRVVLFGSLARGRFHERSDIDLAVEGLPPGKLTDAMAIAEEGSHFQFGIVPLEAAFDYIRAAVGREGIQLWPR